MTRGTQHPSDGDDATSVLRRRDEVRRQYDTVSVSSEADYRLVEDVKVAPGECIPEIPLTLQVA